jgi:YidC/Oxa1 family membrane protein insertase
MENRRFILLAVIGVLVFFIYQAWQTEHAAKRPVTPPTLSEPAQAAEATQPTDDVPTLVPDGATTPTDQPTATAASTARVRFQTDLYSGEIALQGGELRQLELKGYPVSKNQPDRNVALLTDQNGRHFVIQSGIATSGKALGSHLDAFSSAATDYAMAADSEVLEVPLEHVDAAGNRVIKTYRFHRGSYEFELVQQLETAAGDAVGASPYIRLVSNDVPAGEESRFIHTFMGVGVYEAKPDSDSYRFKKLKFKNLGEEPYKVSQGGGWIAMLQHYFAAAILPPEGETHTFESKTTADGNYVAQYVGPSAAVNAGTAQTFETKLYVGPKLQDSIGKAAKGLELTVDYGILTAIAEPLFWVMKKLHEYTGNWGVAIILLTVLVKALFYKLSEAQYRSTAKMRKFAPRIAELKERYADDRERMSKAMMDLYKKEGFNPLAGCWPLLVQMPVFFSLYWVFLESVELRQADFALWITDLTSPDPYYVLPVIYGISMFAMQKLSGQMLTMDPMQQKVMNVMPIALTGFFAFFPSGLVLYWCVSNIISITQQWYITRKLEKEGLPARAAK